MLVDRRGVLGLVGTAVVGGLANSAVAKTGGDPVVRTRQGKVRGVSDRGIYSFKGLRYGASTAGANRFMPPRPAPTWDGIVDAVAFAPAAPQAPSVLIAGEQTSEDCLRLNIWTPAVGRGKRPVMVWFHGGGFEAGSGSRSLYDGTNLSRRGNVVVVTLNHRLGVTGHCYLGQTLGEEFASSGNVGFLDLVAALHWVRDNISGFGGDPGNVTIFGQSGGGRKVSLSYAAKSMSGLFNRGIIQSGSHLALQSTALAQTLTDGLLAELGIASVDAKRLQTVPLETLIAANTKVIAKAGYRFSPLIDGITFDRHPFLEGAPAVSSKLPLMVGTTRTELSLQMANAPGVYTLTEAQLAERIGKYIPPEEAPALIAAVRKSLPDAPLSELYFTVLSALSYGHDQAILAEQRARGAGAPTYVYRVMWRTPAAGGRLISPHTLEIPFAFDNVEAAPEIAGPPSAATAALTRSFSDSWIAFARTGNPNTASMPKWEPYDLVSREVMMFDVPAKLVSDPQKTERELIGRYPSQQEGKAMLLRG